MIGKDSVSYDMAKVSKKAKSVTVPDTIKIGKDTYKVTEIESYAFVGCDNLTTVTVGKMLRA